MYVAQGFLLRTAIVLGMVAAVVTILYFTPMPDQYFLSCERPCHDLDWPMICRIKLTLENHKSESSECDFNNCTTLEGIPRGVLAVNRRVPGPSIQVCQNDILVVDVINKIPGQSVTIHWRGQPQNEAPTMDGVPMVTQCPISSYTTFQYKFRASSAGTHLWHAHAGSEIADGVFGSLIVRQPRKQEPHRKLFDVDDRSNVIVISELNQEQPSTLTKGRDGVRTLLINGKKTPEQSNFRIAKGKRYRFRVAYTGGPFIDCSVTLSIQRHLLKVIALDGNPITPYEVSSVTLSKGERLDFVLKANRGEGIYKLTAVSNCHDITLEGHGLVTYEGTVKETPLGGVDRMDVAKTDNLRIFDTGFCESKLGQVCISDVRSLMKLPQSLANAVDKRIYLGFDYEMVSDAQDSNFGEGKNKVYRMNNITFTYPPSPLLTQREDVPQSNICNSLKKPSQCQNSKVCECVHVEEILLGDTVELIIVDQGGDSEETIFHLHGYKFYVMGYKKLGKRINLSTIQRLNDEGNLLKLNFISPVMKDTVRVPKFSAVVVRFIANNPGYWMLRDESSKQWSRGLDVILQVGDSCDMVGKPSNFPTCGSWVGPDFFLI